MANTIRIKRRAAGGAAGAPSSLENAELAFNEVDDVLYYGKGSGGAGGTATTVEAIAGKGAFVGLTGNQTVAGDKTFSGTVTVPTPTANGHAATKAYVDGAVPNIAAGSGISVTGTTTKTIAADATIARLDSPALTGTPTAPTAAVATNTTQIATTAYVKSQGYLTANQTVTLSGDVTGSGGTAITTTLANSGVTAGTYNNVATQVRPFTVDAKGRVTAIGTAVTITPAWSSISGTPTTLSGYGITDAIPSSQKGAANGVASLDANGLVPSNQLPSYVDDVLEYAALANFPATGETSKIYVANDTNKIYRWSGSAYIEISPTAGNADTATKLATARSITATGDASWTVSFDGSANVSAALTLANSGATAGTYRSVTVNAKGLVTGGTNPTTLSGYGITDAQPLDADLTAIAALAGTAGLLRKTAANTWSLDTAAYLTGNQTITFTGDATGSGATSVALTLANSGVTAGTYRSVTVNAKGLVTGGTNPTTLAGYGITDAQPLDTELTAIAGLTSAADRLPYFTGSGTAALATFTAFGRNLVDDADAAAGRTTLGLGTIATQNANNVAITGGSITNLSTFDGVTIDGGTF
jgi:hypothetical protein